MACALVISGCKQDQAKVYEVPKEAAPPPSAAAAQNPHQATTGHGMGAEAPKITYQAPEGWAEQPASGMRAARFTAPGKHGHDTDISAIALAGMQVGKVDIVNLWREQIKLPPAKAEELSGLSEKVTVGEHAAELFDMASTQPLIHDEHKVRILVAMMSQGDTLWFFKVTGEDDSVREQKSAFLKFLGTVKFEQPSAAAMPAMTAGAAAPAGDPAGKPQWAVPTGWKEVPPTQMLVSKFVLSGQGDASAEVTVSVFPGDVGGVPANINRWRRQISLPPAEQAELDKLTTPLEVADGKALMVDMGGGKDPKSGKNVRLVGVVIPQGGRTWFYKLLGDEAVVEREKTAFTKFAQTAKHSNAP